MCFQLGRIFYTRTCTLIEIHVEPRYPPIIGLDVMCKAHYLGLHHKVEET